ncbi:hypothetical protein [Flavobacterium glaciei]|uniref:Uncharacterized protein n=1 Tax=Flavobacterium glaciei TaxID=386300 RepID=A0A562PEW8_9FLAO|nr:hypothetical protein [Flavobacterium glaciei]RDI48719.1 hypothetical protein DFR66_1372 [Flavobacterium glaciei]TWI42546.1 hypothetical protein IQ02_02915 [Flavobacterium glaciei]
MENNKLKDFEIEELEFMIPQIEKMYNFEFDKDKTQIVNSFEELCDLIIEKINLKNVESCTSQQAFYKLRKSLVETKIIEKEDLKTETELEKLFPRKNRKVLIRKVENEISIKLNILKAPDFITIPLFAIGIISFILLFIYWQLGIIGISISVIGLYFCKWFGNELKLKSVKELVEKITNENYLSVRTQKNTINKTELKSVLTKWFSENTGIEKERLKIATFE